MANLLSGFLQFARTTLYWTGIGNNTLVRSVYNRLIGLAKYSGGVVLVQGHKMVLDRDDALNLSVLGVTERLTTKLVKQQLAPGQTAIDIGANIGYFTLILANMVGPQGRVVAFEVSPENCQLLRQNIALNRYTNITVEDHAISSESGTLKLFLSPSSIDHRIFDSQDGRPYHLVKAVSLDEYCESHPQINQIDFIKMDIQGAEGMALCGMRNTLSRNQSLKLVVEFWPYGLRTAGTQPAQFLSDLTDLGFTLYRLTETHIEETTTADIVRLYDDQKDEFSCNLFCVKGTHDRARILSLRV